MLQTECEMLKEKDVDNNALDGVKVKTEPKDDVDPKAGNPKVRFISDTMSMRIPGTKATPCEFRVTMQYIESELAKRCTCAAQGSLARDNTDQGISTIYEKDGHLVCKEMPTRLRLNYWGTLTICPSDGLIKIATLFGTPVYVGSKYSSTSPWYVPAWGIKPHRALFALNARAKAAAKASAKAALEEGASAAAASVEDKGNNDDKNANEGKATNADEEVKQPACKKPRKSKGNEDKDKLTEKESEKAAEAPLEVKYQNIQLKLKELKGTVNPVFFKSLPDFVDIDIPYCVPSAWAVGKTDIRLTRPSIKGMLSKDSAREAQSVSEQKKDHSDKFHAAADKAVVEGGNDEIKAADKLCKHLRL